jgi:myo-inositol-1(or 4)-monophosphatase
MSGQIDLAARLPLAESVARRAGALARAYFDDRDSLTVVSKRPLQDMVSAADRDVETMMVP